ncbi:MAG: DUF3606 domain-containing protein [Chitinophagaceae bacterium]
MANENSSKGRSQDRRKIAGGQDHEVNYEKNKLNTSSDAVKASVKKVGNERKNVEADIKKKKE